MGGRLCPPLGTNEFADGYRVSELQFARRTESSAPTDFLKNLAKFYSKMQIMPPVFSLIMRESVFVSFWRASSGMRWIFVLRPSVTRS